MPNFGPDYDLATRIKRIEDWIARQNANPLGQAFSVTQSDGSVGLTMGQASGGSGGAAMRFYQGPNTSRDANTGLHPMLLYLGQLVSGGQFVNSGFILYRPDGTESMLVGDRGVQVYDDKGNQVLGTDEYGSSPSNEGLRNPQLVLPTPQATGTGSWPKTNSTSLGTIAWSQFTAQHAKVWWVAQYYADSGTNGTVQLQLSGPNGATVTGPSYTVTGGQFAYTNDTLTLPSGFWHQAWTANVQAQVTAGTGNVYCQTLNLYGLT